MTIPKVIHYCWFGNNNMPKEYKSYINNWHKQCPDYKFICWTEDNFDYNKFLFTKKAYEEKNFAFVSDYVRLYALKTIGGIYLDIDVELLKPLNPLLLNNSFIGMENWDSINSGLVFGSEPDNTNIDNILNIYNSIPYCKNTLNETANTVYLITSYFHKLGFKYKNKIQRIHGCTIYPTEYFCPQSRITNRLHITKNTYTIHHYNDSWSGKNHNKKVQFNIVVGDYIKRILRPTLYNYLYHKYLKIKNYLKYN